MTRLMALIVAAMLAAPVVSLAQRSPRERAPGNLTPQHRFHPAPRHRTPATLLVPAGTALPVRVGGSFDSGRTPNGSAWHGTVTRSVSVHGRRVIPAGSIVSGRVITRPAHRGNRAMVRLRVTGVRVGGRHYAASGLSPAVIAGSPRTRNLGGVAAGTAAGAILGHAVGHSTKATVVGGLIGAGTSSAVVYASHGYQAKLPAGTVLVMHTTRAFRVRR